MCIWLSTNNSGCVVNNVRKLIVITNTVSYQTINSDSLCTYIQDSQCPERAVLCKYCELEVKAADYDSHVDACGSRTDFCDKCNCRVMLKDMEEHKLAKCGDLKAVEFPLEPTMENLPPAYFDGFSAGDLGGISQGPLIGGDEYFHDQGALGGLGMPPDFLQGSAMYYGGARGHRQRKRQEENVQVSDWLYFLVCVLRSKVMA